MSRLSLRALGLAALIAAGLPSSAVACRFNAPIPDRIANSGADTILLVVVQSAAYQTVDYVAKPWSGVAVLRRALKGGVEGSSFAIGRSGASTACDDGVPAPRPGDLWVIYFKGRERPVYGAAGVDYPLAVALEADPGLRALLTAADLK